MESDRDSPQKTSSLDDGRAASQAADAAVASAPDPPTEPTEVPPSSIVPEEALTEAIEEQQAQIDADAALARQLEEDLNVVLPLLHAELPEPNSLQLEPDQESHESSIGQDDPSDATHAWARVAHETLADTRAADARQADAEAWRRYGKLGGSTDVAAEVAASTTEKEKEEALAREKEKEKEETLAREVEKEKDETLAREVEERLKLEQQKKQVEHDAQVAGELANSFESAQRFRYHHSMHHPGGKHDAEMLQEWEASNIDDIKHEDEGDHESEGDDGDENEDGDQDAGEDEDEDEDADDAFSTCDDESGGVGV